MLQHHPHLLLEPTQPERPRPRLFAFARQPPEHPEVELWLEKFAKEMGVASERQRPERCAP